MKLYLSHILSTLTIVFAVLFQLYIPVSHELEHIIDLSLAACPAYNVSPEFANVYSGVRDMNLTRKPIFQTLYSYYHARPFDTIQKVGTWRLLHTHLVK